MPPPSTTSVLPITTAEAPTKITKKRRTGSRNLRNRATPMPNTAWATYTTPANAVKKAEYWLRKAAEQGHAKAQYYLGNIYIKGKEGVESNPEEAVMWYRKAAEQGHRASVFRLAECLYKGKGVPQNLTEAAKLLLQEAEQGNTKACYLIGRCYRYGEGVDKNIDEAVKWFGKAAANGDKSAKESISEIKATGK